LECRKNCKPRIIFYLMDLPIDLDELDVIIESVSDVDTELCRKLRLVKGLVEDGKPYKKILREKYGYVA